MPGATPPWRRAQAHRGEHRPLTVSPGQPRSPGPAPRSLLWLLTGASPASPRLHLLWRFGQVVAVTVHVGRRGQALRAGTSRLCPRAPGCGALCPPPLVGAAPCLS